MNNQSKIKTYNLSNVKYKTITEGFDWGPAITKVIINIGYAIDKSTLSKDTFSISSVKKYNAVNLKTMVQENKPTVETKRRDITAIYLSDAKGKADDNGTYITAEMKVGPDMPESSPFYFNPRTELNTYVDTSYIIEINKSGSILTKDGKTVAMKPTDKSGYDGNCNIIADEFDTAGSYTNGNITLKYASYTPKTVSAEKGSNPLIIWLHGAGEGGQNPTLALLGNKVVNLASQKIQSFFGKTGAYVLVPQCKTVWMDYDGMGTYNDTVKGSGGKSFYTETLIGLIKYYVSKHPEIDSGRLYIGGCSNGGFMTMNMIINFPDYFAAAFPVCESYSAKWLTQERVEAIKNIPVWLTAAKPDGTVPIYKGTMDNNTMEFKFELDKNGNKIALDDFSNAAYGRLKKAGAKDVHYSLWDKVADTSGKYFKAGSTSEPYEYLGHFSWIYALNNECKDNIGGKEVSLFQWLSEQSK